MRKINEQFPDLVKTYDPQVYEFANLFLEHARTLSGERLEPYQLAQGYCFYFAYVFHRVLGGELHSWMLYAFGVGHVVVKFKGRFFDGNHLGGRLNSAGIFQQLGAGGETFPNQTLAEFKQAWNLGPQLVEHFEQTVERIQTAKKGQDLSI